MRTASVFRLIAVGLLLIVEVVCGSLVFETPEISAAAENGPLVHLLASAYVVVRSVVFFLACTLLLLSRRLKSLVLALTETDVPSWPLWLSLHGIVFGIFLHLTVPIFGPGQNPSMITWGAVFGWVLVGCLTLMSALLIVAAPARWVSLLRATSSEIALSGCASILVALGGWFAGGLWISSSAMTLSAVELALSPFYPMTRHPSTNVIGTDSFYVDVSPACSGMEGMALILSFSFLYLWAFREQLRFPHAFLIIPFGICAIWCANVLRIAALIAIGASVSPEIALGGFHSQAGWIAFCGVALGLILVSHRIFGFPSESTAQTPHNSMGANIAGALLVPFLCSVAASMAVDAASADFRVWYPISVIATAGALWAFRRQYRGIIVRPTWMSIGVGVGVFIVWVLIVPESETAGDALLGGIAALSPVQAALWIAFRIVGCVITVPIAEELAFRGYLLGKLARSSLDSVPATRFTWLSFAVSSLLFGLLHSNWLAGAVAGAGFAMAYYSRGRIIDAIAAHMVSNALIVLAVLAFNRWDLWA